jgi:uncharacterized phage-associated protein
MSAVRHTALDVATWFLKNIDRSAGDSVTHLKLQKLVYYAQAWSLALLKRPFFEEDFQAWAHGPVAPSVYRAFAVFGWDSLPSVARDVEFDDDQSNLLKEIADIYGQYQAKQLEGMTHAETPWVDARGALPPEAASKAIISKQAMQDFYSAMHARVNG